MVGQQCISYAVCLIAAHFGDIVAKVCECLIRHGPLSLLEVIRFTELPHGKVKDCLVALIQHNCVQAFSIPKIVEAEATMPNTVYAIILCNIIHRMRFMKFSLIVKDHLGNQCSELFEGFLQHGRLTFELLYDQTSGHNGRVKKEDVLAKFNKLVQAQYIERCPMGESFHDPKTDDKVSSIRKCIKHKHEVLETDEGIPIEINTNEVLWRVNYEKFVLLLKKKTCVGNVRSRFGLDAAIVLEAMIEESNDHQNVTVNSATSSMNSIIKRVREKPGGISLTLELVLAILEQLGCQLCLEESGTLYAIGLKDIIETCQHDEVESFVLKKYGKKAYRIFRLLIKTGRWIPTDQISDKSFIEKKEAHKILCELWNDGCLEMEKVNLNVGVKSELFLWKVNKKILWEHVLDDMFHAALNISQKISQTTEECQVSHADVQKVQRLKRTRCILETSLSKIDDAIMLFHDF